MEPFALDQIEELRRYCTNVASAPEGGCRFLLLEGMTLPGVCTPTTCDGLLCPTPRDGYQSRLFFSVQIASPRQLNWNVNGLRILERNWHAFSWKVETPGLRLAEVLVRHLEAFTRC